MGNFYTNVVVRGPGEDDVVSALESLRRSCYVVATDGFVFVYDEEADEQREGVVESLALTLATRLTCPSLASLNHDDNLLLLWLYDANGAESRYGRGIMFDDGGQPKSRKAFAEEIRRDFGTSPSDHPPPPPWQQIMRVLLPGSFVVVEHQRILEMSGIPASLGTLGYGYVAQGELEDREPGIKARMLR